MNSIPRTAVPRIIFVIPEDWYFWTHRLPLARAMRRAGFDVVVATRVQEHGARITAEGFRVAPIHLRRSSRNPLRDIISVFDLARLYRRERPALVHHVTLKPVLYGSFAARLTGVPAVVNAIAGLGYAFVDSRWRIRVLRVVIRMSLKIALFGRHRWLILQTEADRRELIARGIAVSDRAVVIRGAGVNTDQFTPPAMVAGRSPVVMFAGRLLWNKGVGDLVEAGRLLAHDGRKCRIVLVGNPDVDNPMAVSERQLREWQQEGAVEWWGKRDDMAPLLQEAAIVALPSFYGEGVPKILLEAAASGCAIVASDLPGCRDIVRDGETGLIVPPRRPDLLAGALRRLLDDQQLRAAMGARARALAVQEFSQETVVAATLRVYRTVLSQIDCMATRSCGL